MQKEIENVLILSIMRFCNLFMKGSYMLDLFHQPSSSFPELDGDFQIFIENLKR